MCCNLGSVDLIICLFLLTPAQTCRSTMFPLFISKELLLCANACTRLMFMSWAFVSACVCFWESARVCVCVYTLAYFFLLIKLLR